MSAITLQTDVLRATVDVDHGGDILFLGRVGGLNALFHEPWNTPQPAGKSRSYGSTTLDWLSRYRGGWQVMFPNAGAECVVDGLTHPVHGDVSSSPAEVREAGSNHVTVHSEARSGLRLERRISLADERPALLVSERIENPTDRPLPYLWGHHPALAVTSGMKIDLPAGPIRVDHAFDDPAADLVAGAVGHWPRVPLRGGGLASLDVIPEGVIERVCFLPDRPAGWAAVRDPDGSRGVGMAWDVAAFPHLWLWEQLGGPRFPFHGRANLVALEPVSSWPSDGLASAMERGTAAALGPHASASAWVTMSLFSGATGPVGAVERDGVVSFVHEGVRADAT